MALASLVLGIISILMSFTGLIPGLSITGGIFGMFGIIFGAMGRKDPDKYSMATVGLICSIIGTIMSFMFIIACGSCIGCASLF